jgi:phosphinothricin acetyltransferase
MPLDIRPAQTGDLGDMLAIENAQIRQGVAHFGTEPATLAGLQDDFRKRDPRHPWLVACDTDLMGYALASPWNPRGAYAWTAVIGVYVRPDAHRLGVGRLLVTELIAQLERNGVRRLTAVIALPNPGSVGLFESLEFHPIGVFPQSGYKHGAWHDVGYWVRQLGDGPPTSIVSA